MKANMLKKLLLSFVAATILFTSMLPLFARPAKAQTWYNQPYNEWFVKVYDPDNPDEIFGERYTSAQVEWVIFGLVSFVLNGILPPELTFCLMQPRPSGSLKDILDQILTTAGCAGIIGDVLKSIISVDTQLESKGLLAGLTGRPVSGAAYFIDIGERLNLVPEAKAQGFGFEAAKPVLELWKFVRNTTYFLMVIVIVVMAFMIMFRVKLSPQTVITVQSALPNIIITLILITFSFAIAGLLIDLMYVVMGLLAAILTSGGDTTSLSRFSWTQMYEALTNRGVIELMLSYFVTFLIVLIPAVLFGGILTAAVGVASFFAGGIIPILLILLVVVILGIGTIRILWLMLRTYVIILLQIIASPIIILLGAFGQGGFSTWLRTMVAHLAVFPAVGFLFFMAFVFLRAAWPSLFPNIQGVAVEDLFAFNINNTLGGAQAWNAPFTIGEVAGSELIWLAVSFAIIMLIPNIANIIKGMIENRPFAAGTAIGQAVGAPLGAAWGSAPSRQVRGQAANLAAYRGFTAAGKIVPSRIKDTKFYGGLGKALRASTERGQT